MSTVMEFTDKEMALLRFAVWGMMNAAYGHANEEAQNKDGSTLKVDRFLEDAKRCEAMLARLKS